jgi:hypothetical protein
MPCTALNPLTSRAAKLTERAERAGTCRVTYASRTNEHAWNGVLEIGSSETCVLLSGTLLTHEWRSGRWCGASWQLALRRSRQCLAVLY